MKLWNLLYLIVWLVFLDFVLVLTPVGDRNLLVWGHAILGVAVLALAYVNMTEIRKTKAPDRLKRISRVTLSFAAVQLVLGIFLFLSLVAGVEVPLTRLIDIVHVVIALAIITQASSVATAYDMWEEKEFKPKAEGAPSVA